MFILHFIVILSHTISLHPIILVFRPKHSCDTALLKMTDDWLCNIDQENITGLIYIDLKKAFDTVNHTIMIQKLAVYGVS